MAYNGWNNYETWCVALWASNEQHTYNLTCAMAQDAYDNAEPGKHVTRTEQATMDLADALKEWMDSENPLAGESSLWSDLLGAALSEVDWREWAENLMEDVDKEEEEIEDEEVEPEIG